MRRIPEHLLPVAGIKSIAQKLTDHDLYTIEIIDSYKPIGEAFNIGYAEAKLPDGFVKVIN